MDIFDKDGNRIGELYDDENVGLDWDEWKIVLIYIAIFALFIPLAKSGSNTLYIIAECVVIFASVVLFIKNFCYDEGLISKIFLAPFVAVLFTVLFCIVTAFIADFSNEDVTLGIIQTLAE